MIKVQPNRSPGLCATCREGVITEHADGTVFTVCNVLYNAPRQIRSHVVKCSDYDRRGRLNQHELEKIAWTIQTDKSGQAIGFAPPKKRPDDD